MTLICACHTKVGVALIDILTAPDGLVQADHN